MHAGSGLLHDETPLPGETELIQLWINSPARHKMDRPSYHPLSPDATPARVSHDGLVTLHIVAGDVSGVKGPIRTLTPVNAATIDAKKGGSIDIGLPATHNAFVYLLDGSLRFADGTTASGLHQVVFNTDGDGIHFDALESTRALLMSGEPLGEPAVSYGPFVMNTEEEIRAAFRDYRNGPWDWRRDPLRRQASMRDSADPPTCPRSLNNWLGGSRLSSRRSCLGRHATP
jgi:redox-sensitive bicupin YhaK (pirin superfamily)